MNNKNKLLIANFILFAIILLNAGLVFGISSFSGSGFSSSGSSYGTSSSTGFSGGYMSSYSGIRVYGASANPQFNNPGFLSSSGFTPVGVYWPKFGKEDCLERQDFIMQIAPGGCSPAVVRSDLLEEQDVPVFCKVMSVQVNPLIDVTKIRSLRFQGTYPKGVSGLSYFPAQAAIKSQNYLVSSPVKDNLGYLVVVLSRNEFEKNMPEYVTGNVTAVIDYDVQNAFGIGNTNFYVNEMNDEDWLRNYQQYGFWNGKGYIRADSIDSESAVISVYRDADTKVSTLTLKKGEVSKDVYLGGYYCAAGLNIQLENLDAPIDSALLQINDQQVWVSKGDRILGGCYVSELQTYGGGGKLRINCPVANGKIDLSLNPGKVSLIINGNEQQKTVGEKLIDDGENSVYLAYVGADKGLDEMKSNKKYAILIKDAFSYNEYSFADKEIYNSVERIIRTNNKRIDEIKENIRNEILNQYRRKVSGYGAKFDESKLKIEIIEEGGSAFGIMMKEISVAKNKAWNLNNEQDRIAKEYYDGAIKKYADLASFYANEKMIQDSNEDPYAAVGLYNSAELARKMGMNEDSQEYYNRLIKEYPDSNVARIAVRNKELLMKYDSFNSKAILNYNNEQYFIDVLDFKKPGINDASAVLMINGKPETLALNDVKIIDKKGSIQLKEIKDDYVAISYNTQTTNYGFSDFYYNKNYDYSSGNTRRIGLHEQVVFNDVVVNLAEVRLNKQAKLRIIPKAFGPRGQANFSFTIGIEKRGINLSTEQTKSIMNGIDRNLKEWNDINEKLGKVVKGLKAACFATSAVLTVKNLVAGFSGESMARKEIMTGQKGWNDFCEKLVSDKTNSKYTSAGYDSVQSCLLGHGKWINEDVSAYSKKIQETNDAIKSLQGEVKRTDILDLQGQVDAKEVENKFKQTFNEYCKGLTGDIALPDKDVTKVSIKDVCSWDSMNYEQRREIMTLINSRETGSSVMKDMIDAQLGKTVLEAKNFQEYEGARLAAEKEANQLNLGVGLLTPAGDSITYGPVKRLTASDLTNPAYKGFKEGDNVVRVFVPIKQNFGGRESFVADSSVAGKEVIVKVKTDATSKDYVPDKEAQVYSVNGERIDETGLKDVNKYMSEAKLTRIRAANPKAYQNKILNPENLKVEYFERAPYKGLPAMVPFDVENGWYVQMQYVLSGFGVPYDQSGRAVNYYICNVGQNGLIEFKKSADDICRYYNGVNNDLSFEGLAPGESAKLVAAAQRAIQDAARQYGKKQVLINGRRLGSGISFGGEEGRCSDFMSPEDCNIIFNVCDPVICPSSRCDLGGRFRVDNVIASGIIGSLTLCLPNIKEGVLIPVCLSGVYAGIENYVSILNSTRQCLNESLETGRNVGICDEIKSIYLCEFFWKQASPLINVVIPRLIELIMSQGVRGGGEYLTVQKAWDNTQSAIDYFRNDYAVNSMNAFRARTTEEIGSDVCKSFVSVNYPSQNIIDKLIEPDSPLQYSAWFSENALTTATIPPTSHYKVYYHIYAGKDIGAYYSVYLKDLPQSNYVFVSGTYIVDSGYIGRGAQVDQAKDFTAVSGYKQLCVNVNGQEKCDFGKVSTSYAVNYISDAYAAEQVQTGIVNEKECIAGTSSLLSLVQPNLQAGVEQTLNPELYNKGIVRVCASQNPGKQVLANGQYDTTQTTYDKWKEVGYCDDPMIKCWLDTSSVKDVIKDKGIEKEVLQNVNLKTLGVEGYLTEDSSREIASRAEKAIADVDVFPGLTKNEIENKISGIVNMLNQLTNLGTNNVYRARGLYLFGRLYQTVSEKLIESQTNTLNTAPAPTPATRTPSDTNSNIPSPVNPAPPDIKTKFSDDMLNMNVNIHVYYNGIAKTAAFSRKDFVLTYNNKWLVGDNGFYSSVKNMNYVDGIYYLATTMGAWDSVMINNELKLSRGFVETDDEFSQRIFESLMKNKVSTGMIQETSESFIMEEEFVFYDEGKTYAKVYEKGNLIGAEIISFDYQSQTVTLPNKEVKKIMRDANGRIVFSTPLSSSSNIKSISS